MNAVPKHVAIIMDGNGRWAQSRNLDRTQGHIEGVKRVEDISEIAYEMGVKVLTLFTFSTENWSRPESEVSILMQILANSLRKKITKLKETNMKFQTIGRRDPIPKSVLDAIDNVVEETKHNTGLVLNLALNYGSRIEIVEAIKSIASQVRDNKLNPEGISEAHVSNALYTKGLPDPDLLIRTSGEKRISNFLLWQLSYAEFYFTEKYWPEFDKEEFRKAILEYQNRERRFGHSETIKA